MLLKEEESTIIKMVAVNGKLSEVNIEAEKNAVVCSEIKDTDEYKRKLHRKCTDNVCLHFKRIAKNLFEWMHWYVTSAETKFLQWEQIYKQLWMCSLLPL